MDSISLLVGWKISGGMTVEFSKVKGWARQEKNMYIHVNMHVRCAWNGIRCWREGALARVFNFPGNGSIFFFLLTSVDRSIQVGIPQFGRGADVLTLPAGQDPDRGGRLLASHPRRLGIRHFNDHRSLDYRHRTGNTDVPVCRHENGRRDHNARHSRRSSRRGLARRFHPSLSSTSGWDMTFHSTGNHMIAGLCIYVADCLI